MTLNEGDRVYSRRFRRMGTILQMPIGGLETFLVKVDGEGLQTLPWGDLEKRLIDHSPESLG